MNGRLKKPPNQGTNIDNFLLSGLMTEFKGEYFQRVEILYGPISYIFYIYEIALKI